jgi:hypothetical protein
MDKIFRKSFGNVGQQDLEKAKSEFQGDEDGNQERNFKNIDEEDQIGEEIPNDVSSELFPSSSPAGRTGPRPRSAKGRLRTTGRAAGDLFPNSKDRTELSNFLLDRGAKDEDNGNGDNYSDVDRVRSMSVSRTPSPSPSPSPFPSPNRSLNASAFDVSPHRRNKSLSPQRSARKQPINHDTEFRVGLSNQHASNDVIISKSLQEAINKSVEMSFKNLLENISLKNLLLQEPVKEKKGDLKKKKSVPSLSSSGKTSSGSTKSLKEKGSCIPHKNNIHEYISENEGIEGSSAIRTRIRKMRQQILSNERNKEIHRNISENVFRSNSQSFKGMAPTSIPYRNGGSINTTNSKVKGIKVTSEALGSSQPKADKDKPVKKGKRNP